MGTKYIIEVEDKPFELLSEDGFTSEKLFRVKGFNSLVFDWNGLNKLTPYTEPDLEQVRKEAYDRGYDDAKGGYENGFENGMIVAWDAARKIGNMPYGEEERVFGSGGWAFIEKHTASEAIEKIRQYEQEQEEFQVGDEVELKCGVRPAIYMQGTKGSDEIYLLFNDGSCGQHSKSEIERKTGRHFPEIATILEKMRGEQDG